MKDLKMINKLSSIKATVEIIFGLLFIVAIIAVLPHSFWMGDERFEDDE